jgi:hypothetical protein
MTRMKELEEENLRQNDRYILAQLSADLRRESLASQWCGPRRVAEEAEIPDWLVRLTTPYRTWGLRWRVLDLRSVKPFD